MAMRARLLATCHCMLRRSDTHIECHKYQPNVVCWQSRCCLLQASLAAAAAAAAAASLRWSPWCSPVASSHHSVYESSSHVSTYINDSLIEAARAVLLQGCWGAATGSTWQRLLAPPAASCSHVMCVRDHTNVLYYFRDIRLAAGRTQAAGCELTAPVVGLKGLAIF